MPPRTMEVEAVDHALNCNHRGWLISDVVHSYSNAVDVSIILKLFSVYFQ